MFRDLGPVARAVDLQRLQQQELLVAPPVRVEERDGEVLEVTMVDAQSGRSQDLEPRDRIGF